MNQPPQDLGRLIAWAIEHEAQYERPRAQAVLLRAAAIARKPRQELEHDWRMSHDLDYRDRWIRESFADYDDDLYEDEDDDL